jgi:hypothetical protein
VFRSICKEHHNTLLASFTLAALMPLAQAQEVVSISAASDGGRVNEDIAIQVGLRSNGQSVYCGLRVDYGNGVIQDIRIENEAGLTQNLQARYPNPGRYTITVRGRTLVRGLKTLTACSGERSFTVNVADPAVEQIKKDLERARQEVKERDEREARNREEQLRRREAEAARREEEARQREAQARQIEAEVRRKEEEVRRKDEEARKAAQEAERARAAAAAAKPPAPAPAPAAAKAVAPAPAPAAAKAVAPAPAPAASRPGALSGF